MRKIIVSLWVVPVIVLSVEAISAGSTPSRPVTKPSPPLVKPVRPIRPIVNTGPVYQDNYYTTNVETSCEKYVGMLAQKDQEIVALKQEIERLKKQEQSKLQQRLKEDYDKELKKFDNRKSSIHTKNKAVISDRPID